MNDDVALVWYEQNDGTVMTATIDQFREDVAKLLLALSDLNGGQPTMLLATLRLQRKSAIYAHMVALDAAEVWSSTILQSTPTFEIGQQLDRFHTFILGFRMNRPDDQAVSGE